MKCVALFYLVGERVTWEAGGRRCCDYLCRPRLHYPRTTQHPPFLAFRALARPFLPPSPPRIFSLRRSVRQQEIQHLRSRRHASHGQSPPPPPSCMLCSLLPHSIINNLCLPLNGFSSPPTPTPEIMCVFVVVDRAHLRPSGAVDQARRQGGVLRWRAEQARSTAVVERHGTHPGHRRRPRGGDRRTATTTRRPERARD